MKRSAFCIAYPLVALVLTACSGSLAPAEPEPDQPPGENAPMVDWVDPTKTLTLADGWTIRACEGDAPLLCVEKDGNPVGGVEALAHRLDTMSWFDPGADIEENLASLAEDFARVIEDDRAIGCGVDYVFEPFSPETFVLGNQPGIAYGFTGTMPDGSPSELSLHYATIVEDQLISVVASAQEEGGCPGRDELSGFTTSSLAEFRPHLEQVLHESPLPELES